MQLVTRMDFDGLLSAAMIYEMERIEEINFANPKEWEEGRVRFEFDVGDAVVHLPFNPDCRLFFHNHAMDKVPPQQLEPVRGNWGKAPSTAHLVYDFYNSPNLKKYRALVDLADKIGTANLAKDDIVNPHGWMLINYTLDPRFPMEHEYGIFILTAMRTGKSAEEILQNENVAKRVARYKEDEVRFEQLLVENTKMHGNVIVTDFRAFDDPPRGNRFTVFMKFPEGNVHLRVDKHRDPMALLVSVSKSIFNRTCNVDVGKLMEKYSGGGMEGAGTCPIGLRTANERLNEIVSQLT